MKIKKYRIVTDRYLGYEVQVWRIYFPFWIQLGWVNTHSSIEKAKEYINKSNKSNKVVWIDNNE